MKSNLDTRKYCFVVVDDDPNNVIVLNYILQGSGLEGEVIYFEKPSQALQFFESHTCDLMFLDVEMPEMTGFEFLEKLHNPPYTIVLTSYSQKYAEKAFSFIDRNLIDFISKDNLLKSIPRIKERFIEKFKDHYIYTKCKTGTEDIVRIPFSKIKMLIKSRAFVFFVLEDAPEDYYYLESDLDEVEAMLPKGSFYRIRKGKTIVISHMKYYLSGKIFLGKSNNGKELVLEVPYRERKNFVSFIKNRHSMVPMKE